MLDVRTYTWKDVKNTKIVINSTGTTAKLSEFADSSKTDPIVALESVLKLYGFTNIQISNPTGRNIIFSYDSKYNFLIIQLQNLTINMNVDILNGVIYWKPFQGAATTDYKTWDITNGSLKKTFSTNGEEIYLGYVAEAMSEGFAYLWNNGKDILNQLITPLELVNAIDEDDLNNQELFSSDIVDSYGDTIEYEYLNQIASYHTIPRYYINNKSKSFKGISFDYNVKNSNDNIVDSSSDDGQFVFDEDIRYKAGNKKDAKYWSFYPQVYPIVVFNNMTSIDANYVDVNGSSGYYDKLNEHSFTYSNGKLKIDSTEVNVTNNDEVVFYIRKHGVWQAAQPDPAGKWSVRTNKVLELVSENNTATLTFEPIQLHKWEPRNTTFSFSCDIEEISNFTTNITPKDYAKQIIQSKTDFDESLPVLSGADYDHDNSGGVWLYDRLFVSIGDYDFDTSGWDGAVSNVKKVSDAEFKMTATIKNLEWVSGGNISPYYSQEQLTSNIKIEDYTSDSFVSYYCAWVNANLYKKFQSLIGFFPKKIGYYGDMNNRVEDSGFFEPTTASGTQVDGLQYYNSYYYDFRVPSGGGSTGTGTTSGRTESYRFKLYIGYEQWVQQDTFALAVVVWRNGKLVK